MLLIHQAGAVKVGEVVRYTLTYVPCSDRILPTPSRLYVRIKNTSAIPYRAAYLHGPYTLHVSTYPATFNPNSKLDQPRRDGIPEFESNLKAGGHFHSTLVVPEDVREHGEAQNLSLDDGKRKSMTWIIEIASQILFSNNASVHYEVMVGRDERSLDLGFAAIAAKGYGGPGQLGDRPGGPSKTTDNTKVLRKGVYSNAVDLVVEDTATLWNKPALPSWDDVAPTGDPSDGEEPKSGHKSRRASKSALAEEEDTRPQKKIHLVVLTHGLHSNIGADMLYMKESIDATVREAREQRRSKRGRGTEEKTATGPSSTAPLSGGQEEMDETEGGEDGDDDDEQVIVRGFAGNTTKTERGIQYLGKRLAKYILNMTHPDQPFLPVSKSLTRSMTGSFSAAKSSMWHGTPAHSGSSIQRSDSKPNRRAYRYTSISFIGHSLGGLIQMYAVAYIQKHSPTFFKTIEPVNFIAMASPMLGLSNENPMYVKFALDFGLVGRTGQDLGLTWRAPTLARNGWSSMLASFGAGNSNARNNSNHQNSEKEKDPRAKPLLRILPTGPAHQVLKQFRNRTVYSNVVNDGIVPLRTSCLLFLDWRGLGRVENARRENGLLATLASTGWAELTGANSVSHRPATSMLSDDEFSADDSSKHKSLSIAEDARTRTNVDDEASVPQASQFLDPRRALSSPRPSASGSSGTSESRQSSGQSPLDQFFGFFRPAPAEVSRRRKLSNKAQRTYRRAQIVRKDSSNRQEHSAPPSAASSPSQDRTQKAEVGRADSYDAGPPPKTSVFDAAADILNPPIPPLNWLLDPSSRDRTVFHDRVYHPEDIPPPPVRRPRLGKSFSADSLRRASTSAGKDEQASLSSQQSDAGTMRVEEKIARAYHHHLSWRKVLVRLEPDAHNNMIVRRMFANAYGWDVVKHLCDTHFSDSFSSRTRDDLETNVERAFSDDTPAAADATQVEGQTSGREGGGARHSRTVSELREADDRVAALPGAVGGLQGQRTASTSSWSRRSSNAWDEQLFEEEDEETGDESEGGDDQARGSTGGPLEALQRLWRGEPAAKVKAGRQQSAAAPPKTSVVPKIATDLTQSPVQTHASLATRQKDDVAPESAQETR